MNTSPNRQPEGIFLKVQTTAEKVLKKTGKGVSASFLKSRINALKSWAAEKIRACIFKVLAGAGHGRIEGEGSEMVYIPKATDDASAELVGVGGELVIPPILENYSSQSLQASIGEIDAQVVSSTVSQLSTEAIASSSTQQSFVSTKETEAQQCPKHETLVEEMNITEAIHQFTNSEAEVTSYQTLNQVEETTNSAPTAPTATIQDTQLQYSVATKELAEQILLCSTWVEIVQLVNQNGKVLFTACKEMSLQQRQKN